MKIRKTKKSGMTGAHNYEYIEIYIYGYRQPFADTKRLRSCTLKQTKQDEHALNGK